MLLNTRFVAVLVSGQSTEAAGWSASNWNMRPATNRRWLAKTGVDTAMSPGVRSGSRHQISPVFGFSEVTASWVSWVQTINCLLPPAVTTIGELYVNESSSAFHTSLPEFLSKATTHAAGFPHK